MTAPKFTPQISLGNLLTALGMLVVGTLAFQDVRSSANTNARDIAALTTALEAERNARQAALRDLDAISRANQIAITRAQSDQSNIIAGLARIEARLDRIEPYRSGRPGVAP